MTTEDFPNAWREGNITPIFKKGIKSKPGNYRPVSLTSVASKVFDSIVRDSIVDHMSANNLFAEEQHGFVPGRSCMTQLLAVVVVVVNSLFANASLHSGTKTAYILAGP